MNNTGKSKTFLATDETEEVGGARWVRVVEEGREGQEWFVVFNYISARCAPTANLRLPAATVVWGDVSSREEREAIIAAAQAPKLVDGVERNRSHPMTFTIPTPEEKAALVSGDYVKVGIQSLRSTESESRTDRCWITLTSVGERFAGVIDNVLKFTDRHGMDCGDELQFEARHILDCIRRQ